MSAGHCQSSLSQKCAFGLSGLESFLLYSKLTDKARVLQLLFCMPIVKLKNGQISEM